MAVTRDVTSEFKDIGSCPVQTDFNKCIRLMPVDTFQNILAEEWEIYVPSKNCDFQS